ncbi:MAG TPA: hypothetical protein PKJ97_02485 [Candidatus Bilamarchaeaceae archaeon]|nr:hypothetical protein [Candidatus Bilamarchaeaceae archaeon]
MFEGHDRCALCDSDLSGRRSRKRKDIDGVSHAFCLECALKTEEVEKKLGLSH